MAALTKDVLIPLAAVAPPRGERLADERIDADLETRQIAEIECAPCEPVDGGMAQRAAMAKADGVFVSEGAWRSARLDSRPLRHHSKTARRLIGGRLRATGT